MSFCNGDTSYNIVPSIGDECSLIHHLSAADDDYLSLTGGAEEAAGEVVHPFAICTHGRTWNVVYARTCSVHMHGNVVDGNIGGVFTP